MGRELSALPLPEALQPGNEALTKLAHRHRINLIVLFGSRARGVAYPASDYDLAVLLDDPARGRPTSHPRRTLSAEDSRGLLALHIDLQHLLRTSRVDLVPLDCASPLLAHRIARDGIPLYEREVGIFARFCARAVQRHEDARFFAHAEHDYLRRRFAGRVSE